MLTEFAGRTLSPCPRVSGAGRGAPAILRQYLQCEFVLAVGDDDGVGGGDPAAQHRLERQRIVVDVEPSVRKQLLSTNASKLYNIPV